MAKNEQIMQAFDAWWQTAHPEHEEGMKYGKSVAQLAFLQGALFGETLRPSRGEVKDGVMFI